ncbi:disease resistance RPP13-like protein 4 [Ricinus communis]|uniref:disease resistance RPP13-like protein 4 n=1 Tax=Ricinus communis TaxID=3988 RepID=UPI00201ADB97|nr:disease resistance RPP13-like protein 4 [Ricinus communis]XP_048234785.1 disease resistance RPP13-like protein 4 [Ricinus communis]XP_048234786.1 disease resistance RPP13-like protein 4 [Ricinus communis]
MGGLGKTTITQKIFNNKQVVDRFEKRIWVSISQTFNEEEIMKTMLKQLGEDVNGLDMAQMLPKIKQALENRNYLIVMDDVWSAEGWWDNICAGLPKREGKSSGIIITTRIENLATEMGVEKARIHQPRILNEEESWALFSRIAFALDAEAQQHSDLEEVGKDSEKMWRLTEIKKLNVQKFGEGYLTISRMCWPQESENSIMASLQLSYDELPIRLKQCLLCFSMYPEDSEIWAEQLARWWVGEGFIEGKGTRTAMEMAFDYISELISRCLVEAVQQRGYDGRVYSCKMHDLVRDLTIKIAKEQMFCSFDE